MKKIVTEYKNIEKLSKIFGVSVNSIYKALRYETSGDRPNKIRSATAQTGATTSTAKATIS